MKTGNRSRLFGHGWGPGFFHYLVYTVGSCNNAKVNVFFYSISQPGFGKIVLQAKLKSFAEAFSAGEFGAATLDFEKSLSVTQLMGEADSASMFNIALCAANDNQLEKAAEYYCVLVAGAYPMMGIYNGLADYMIRIDRKADVKHARTLLNVENIFIFVGEMLYLPMEKKIGITLVYFARRLLVLIRMYLFKKQDNL